MDDPVWDVTVFTKNRERLLTGEVAQGFFRAVLAQARQAGLLSDEHFTVDETLIEAWASIKSFQPELAAEGTPQSPPPDDDPDNPSVDFHGERRSKRTPPIDHRLPRRAWYKKSKGAGAKLGPKVTCVLHRLLALF